MKNIVNNEYYIKTLTDNMSDFVERLNILNVDKDLYPNTIENATAEEIEKFRYYYDNAINIVDYYINIKKSTNYINEFAEFIGNMLFLLGSNIENSAQLLDNFYDKVQEYNTMLLDNNMPFNRAIIPLSILCEINMENLKKMFTILKCCDIL